ncbi:MAG TPA: ABC transporter substrate-binding protein, partial [Chloroflexota bacterium]|nr:ABC transporter substrate-binding protein [Chloroflexota bacterium]
MTNRTRRQFLQGSLGVAGLGLVAGCGIGPLGGKAKPQRIFRVGFVKQPPLLDYMDAFSDGMRELGYEEDKNYILDYIYVEDPARLSAAVDQLLKVPVDILVCPNSAAIDAAKKATSTVPIVFVTAANPVATGYVESLAQPGGNLTGPSQLTPGLTSKRLQILNEISPGIRRIGVLWNPSNPSSVDQWQETRETIGSLEEEAISLEVREPQDFAGAFARAQSGGVDALFMPITQVVMVQMSLIAQFALAQYLPAMAFQREFPDAGGLISYGASIS